MMFENYFAAKPIRSCVQLQAMRISRTFLTALQS